MNIEKRLREDAAKFARMQPPADLRARLQASLDAVPPISLPDRVRRPIRRWFTPAVAMLTLAMVLVFVSALPQAVNDIDVPSTLTQSQAPETDDLNVDIASDSKEFVRASSGPELDHSSSLPVGRIGIFAGLALITGFLCVTELKGHPRLLVPALAALALFVTVGLIYIFGVI